jgi:exopolysaccharide biosynthesis polyprenyl glycosylphosphotransferase
LTEGIIARDDAGGPGAVDFGTTLEFGWRGRQRWAHHGLWATLALTGLIGAAIGVLLATEVKIRALGLAGVTVTITGIWFLALRWSADFARERRLGPVLAASMGTAIGLAAVSLLNFWILGLLLSSGQLLIMAGSVFVLAAAFQLVAARGFTRRPRVAVVGVDDDALELIRELHNGKSKQFECIGVVDDRLQNARLDGVPFLGTTDELVEMSRRFRPDLIVCSTDLYTRAVERLLDAGVTSVRVLDSSGFHDHAFHRAASREVPSSWFASVLDTRQQHYSARAKRIFDVTIACLGLVLTFPLLLVIPALIRLSDSGPVLYRQIRIGEGGKFFEMLKFRTMIPSAENGEAVWASENDPRITRVGRVLRETRLDELPQLWNVLRGEMSIVGPRPERPEFHSVLSEQVPYWSRRHLLKPGITGWAQVNFSYTADVSGAGKKLLYDLYYLKHRSLGLDLLILLKTLKVVLLGTGAR